MKRKPRILVSNDDSIFAQGIRSLAKALSNVADVTVAAPQLQFSGGSHAITLLSPLRAMKHYEGGEFIGYMITGTPADCVKLAIAKLLPEKPDLVVAGINHGTNVGINVVYSGTVAVAVEGGLQGIPSLAFSLDTATGRDFDAAAEIAAKLVMDVWESGIPKPTMMLNVNIPGNSKYIKGIRICQHTRSGFRETYQERIDPDSQSYYWVTGAMELEGDPETSDAIAMKNGYVTIAPLDVSFTDQDMIETMSWLKKDF